MSKVFTEFDEKKAIISWWKSRLLWFFPEYASDDGEGNTIFYKKFGGVIYITGIKLSHAKEIGSLI